MNVWPRMSIQLRVRFEQRIGDDVDADVLVALQRVGGGDKKGPAEEVPLKLQPGVRADVEGLADDRISGADQDRERGSATSPSGRGRRSRASIARLNRSNGPTTGTHRAQGGCRYLRAALRRRLTRPQTGPQDNVRQSPSKRCPLRRSPASIPAQARRERQRRDVAACRRSSCEPRGTGAFVAGIWLSWKGGSHNARKIQEPSRRRPGGAYRPSAASGRRAASRAPRAKMVKSMTRGSARGVRQRPARRASRSASGPKR